MCSGTGQFGYIVHGYFTPDVCDVTQKNTANKKHDSKTSEAPIT